MISRPNDPLSLHTSFMWNVRKSSISKASMLLPPFALIRALMLVVALVTQYTTSRPHSDGRSSLGFQFFLNFRVPLVSAEWCHKPEWVATAKAWNEALVRTCGINICLSIFCILIYKISKLFPHAFYCKTTRNEGKDPTFCRRGKWELLNLETSSANSMKYRLQGVITIWKNILQSIAIIYHLLLSASMLKTTLKKTRKKSFSGEECKRKIC